jgi:ABC-type phosphate transport system auxiliary subunit
MFNLNKMVFLGAAAAALVAGSASAQRGVAAPAKQPLTLSAFEARLAAKFARSDVNRDGFLTLAEAETAKAARPSRGERLAAREQRKAKRAQRLARVDTNGDGVVSPAERQARVAARAPQTAEQRADRVEQRAERRAERQALRGSAGLRLNEKRFARLDANGDGRLSLAEATSRVAVRFARLDANKDGSVTREERRQLKAQRQARRNG